ncbi:MAG: cytochrome c3 family protein [Desulfovibrionaceae bacterium]|jgi:hypothetical protein|nr:cytochrome c3 family protein [Desulfovibrionaceae bacterium]
MKKTILLTLLAVAASLLYLLPAFCQEDMRVIEPTAFENPQRPAAVFNHDAHNEKAGIEGDCYLCHHSEGKPDPDNTSEGTPCSDCHAVKAEKGKTGLMQAYHKMCQDCHQAKGKGPIACGECHVRN